MNAGKAPQRAVRGRRGSIRWRIALSPFVCGLILAGCSSVPDAVNPVEWYQGVRGWVAGSDTPPPTPADAMVPQPRSELLNAPFPNLASVPERPRPTMDPGATDRAYRSLEADRAESQRLDRAVRREDAPPPSRDDVLRPETPLSGFAPPDDRTRDVYRRQLAASAAGAAPPAAGEPSPPYAAPGPTVAQPPAAVTPAPLPAPSAGQPTLLATVGFTDGSTAVDGEGKRVLEQVADAYRSRPGSMLQLVGHAGSRSLDPHGPVDFDMSLKRANAVMVALLGMGVPQSAMQVSAPFGADPADLVAMPAGEMASRRVEIYIVY